MTCGRGTRKPTILCHFLAKIAVSSAALRNFSFRQLPWASADFRPQIYCSIQTQLARSAIVGARWFTFATRRPFNGRRMVPKRTPAALLRAGGRPGKPFPPESGQSPRYGSRKFLRTGRIGYGNATCDHPRHGELAYSEIVGAMRFAFNHPETPPTDDASGITPGPASSETGRAFHMATARGIHDTDWWASAPTSPESSARSVPASGGAVSRNPSSGLAITSRDFYFCCLNAFRSSSKMRILDARPMTLYRGMDEAARYMQSE